MSENEKEICVTVELPGVEQKDLKLTIEKDLAIEGEKKEESQSKENGYHHVERSYGSFRRVNLAKTVWYWKGFVPICLVVGLVVALVIIEDFGTARVHSTVIPLISLSFVMSPVYCRFPLIHYRKT